MPEGDTVWRAAHLLDRELSGRELLVTDFRVPQHATADLTGGRVEQTVSRGKHLLTRISHDTGSGPQRWTVHTHLKMEGAWRVFRDGKRWTRPASQARVVLTVPGRTAVGFSLGIVELLPTTAEPEVVGHLGPDLLGPDWDEPEALRRLRSQPDRTTAEALLDQRNLAGVGNMYAAELCFLAGLDPRTPVGEVPDLPRLVRRAKQVLEANKKRSMQSTTGDLRDGENRWVYRRDRRGCKRCGGRIEVVMLGDPGRERATYFCPACQR